MIFRMAGDPFRAPAICISALRGCISGAFHRAFAVT
jgi:hypothetical protein